MGNLKRAKSSMVLATNYSPILSSDSLTQVDILNDCNSLLFFSDMNIVFQRRTTIIADLDDNENIWTMFTIVKPSKGKYNAKPL